MASNTVRVLALTTEVVTAFEDGKLSLAEMASLLDTSLGFLKLTRSQLIIYGRIIDGLQVLAERMADGLDEEDVEAAMVAAFAPNAYRKIYGD